MKRTTGLMALMLSATLGAPTFGDITINWANKDDSGLDGTKEEDKKWIANIEAAIEWWSMTIDSFGEDGPEEFKVNISRKALDVKNFGLTSNFKANANDMPESADIVLDDGSKTNVKWWVDPTPHKSEEFKQNKNTPYHGVPMTKEEAAKKDTFDHDPPAPGEVDLLEVIKHELAHALGFAKTYDKFKNKIVVEDGKNILKYDTDKQVILVDGPTHIDPADVANDLMSNVPLSQIEAGQRWSMSKLDLEIFAGVYGYSVDESALETVPTPGSAVLLALGSAAIWRRRRNASMG